MWCGVRAHVHQVFGNFGGDEGFELVDSYENKPSHEEVRARIFQAVDDRRAFLGQRN